MNSVICCVFTKTKIILILFCLFIAGCVITKVPQQDFLGDNNDSLFISDYVSSNKVDGIIRCLGYRNDGYDNRREYRQDYRQCRRSNGTTGTIIGAIAGGLLGREIGRGGRYNEPSTTGLIIGAGAGALAGRAIDKNGNCR